jgi:hypothetical protein
MNVIENDRVGGGVFMAREGLSMRRGKKVVVLESPGQMKGSDSGVCFTSVNPLHPRVELCPFSSFAEGDIESETRFSRDSRCR